MHVRDETKTSASEVPANKLGPPSQRRLPRQLATSDFEKKFKVNYKGFIFSEVRYSQMFEIVIR